MTTEIAKAGTKEWLGLFVIALPCMLYSMDLTVLNLAVPALSAELKPSALQLLWIVDIYGFLLAGMLITMGTLGDRIGRRKLLMVGATAFGLASILASFSTSPEMLIVARAILGVAGATIAPSTLSLIRNMFADPGQRTFAFAVWITSYSVGGAIGPVAGGLLLEHYSWHSVFLIGVPVMLLLLVLAPLLLPEFKAPEAGRIDVWSALLSLGTVLGIVYGIKQATIAGIGWFPMTILAVGLCMGFFFVRRQKKIPDPLLDLDLFRIPSFSISLGIYLLATFVLFGMFFFIVQFLQLVLGLTPLQGGLWTLPSFASFVIGSIVTPQLIRRFKTHTVMAYGLFLSAVGFGLIIFIGQGDPLTLMVIGLTLFSLGTAPVFTLVTDAIVGSAPPERAGMASSISETGSELGGALGIAILGSIGISIYRMNVAAGLTDPHLYGDSIDTLGETIAMASQMEPHSGAAMIVTARASFITAVQVVATICALLSAVMAIGVIVNQRFSKSDD